MKDLTMNQWPLGEMRNLPWHALQRTLATDVASRLTQKESLTASGSGPEDMTSWLVRALVDTPPARFAQ